MSYNIAELHHRDFSNWYCLILQWCLLTLDLVEQPVYPMYTFQHPQGMWAPRFQARTIHLAMKGNGEFSWGNAYHLKVTLG